MEALKPLVVLVLFGTILYGAYSVVQKGPSTATQDPVTSADNAPPFAAPSAPPSAPPQVELGGPAPAPVAAHGTTSSPLAVQPPIPVVDASRGGPATEGTIARAAGVASPLPTLPPPAGIPADPPPAVVGRTGSGADASPGPSAGATYLTPSAPDVRPPETADVAVRPERIASAGPATTLPVAPPQPPVGIRSASPSSAAFSAAWADAHGKLRAGRYAEALAGLSVWYDDPSLGLEESQQLEDLLSRLAGTVVYSQQDLLLPPHVVAPGETLAAIAAPLGVSTQLLAKINGVDDPNRLVPGEHLKLVRGPFDAVVSASRRRLSLQLNGSYAGSFPVAIGREYLARVGSVLPVEAASRGTEQPAQPGAPAPRRAIVLGGGFVIEAADDPAAAADATPGTSIVVSVRDFGELVDILGPGSRVLVRQ